MKQYVTVLVESVRLERVSRVRVDTIIRCITVINQLSPVIVSRRFHGNRRS